MNISRAGLYSLVPTLTWLRAIGMASPPSLVMLGLTLPDSRILHGIAGIGLTLTNIAFILPHLRQTMFDTLHVHNAALAHEQNTQKQVDLPNGPNSTRPVSHNVESRSLPLASPCNRVHQSPPFIISPTIKSVCSAATGPWESQGVDLDLPSYSLPLQPAKKPDDSQTSFQTSPSPDADPNKRRASPSVLWAQESWGPLHIPLPVPDANFSGHDQGEYCPVAVREQHTLPKVHSTTEVNESTIEKGAKQSDQIVIADLLNKPAPTEIGEAVVVALSVMDGSEQPFSTRATSQYHHVLGTEGTISRSLGGTAAHEGDLQSPYVQGSSSRGEEVLKRRPESLEFIPQSVISRYPSVPMASARQCLGHQGFSSGRDHQVTLPSPRTLVHNPATPLKGTKPHAGYVALERYWHASFLTGVHPRKQLMGGQTFTEDPLHQEPGLLPEPSTMHELTSLRKHPSHRGRLGVLARAALRDRRSTRRFRNDPIDDSSTSDSDSESDSDSQYSSGSSAHGSMLPHMLGADLIAAIDANSESELNLVGSKGTRHTPPNVYEEFLISENSRTDISMIMHVSSNDGASNSEVRAPGTFHSLTNEDIQQWATGVVQKCVRQACRPGRDPIEPSSPSQASDVCAEKPSGSGMSQCPLSGLHCKPGTARPAEVPASKTQGPPVSLPPTFVSPDRKPLSIRSLRDVPEFVPRQRHVSLITGRTECPLGTRSTAGVTRDAATQVIARVEGRSGFNARQWFVGSEAKRLVSVAGGFQGTQTWR